MSFIVFFKKFFFDSVDILPDYFNHSQKINYIDIGASNIKNLIFFTKYKFINLFLFDADKRALKSYISNFNINTNLNIFDKAVWKKKDRKYFMEYKNQASSSLFEANIPKLSEYNLGTKLYDLQNKTLCDLDSLDNLLKNYLVDFIKVDTEGADYEILLGAKKKLKKTLGVYVECQLIERYLGTKSFSEIELLLRKEGFEIFSINQEKWTQSKNYNIDTNIKNVWLDVLFFVDIKTFLGRLKKIKNTEERFFLIKKIIFLMINFKLHDTSLRYLKFIKSENLISEINFIKIHRFIKMNTKSNFKIIALDFFRLILILILIPFVFFFRKKYTSLLIYLIFKNLKNLKRIFSLKLNNTSIFRNNGLDIN